MLVQINLRYCEDRFYSIDSFFQPQCTHMIFICLQPLFITSSFDVVVQWLRDQKRLLCMVSHNGLGCFAFQFLLLRVSVRLPVSCKAAKKFSRQILTISVVKKVNCKFFFLTTMHHFVSVKILYCHVSCLVPIAVIQAAASVQETLPLCENQLENREFPLRLTNRYKLTNYLQTTVYCRDPNT